MYLEQYFGGKQILRPWESDLKDCASRWIYLEVLSLTVRGWALEVCEHLKISVEILCVHVCMHSLGEAESTAFVRLSE